MDHSLKLNTMQLVTPGGTTAVLWQMMYRIKDWFIHLLIQRHILKNIYEVHIIVSSI